MGEVTSGYAESALGGRDRDIGGSVDCRISPPGLSSISDADRRTPRCSDAASAAGLFRIAWTPRERVARLSMVLSSTPDVRCSGGSIEDGALDVSAVVSIGPACCAVMDGEGLGAVADGGSPRGALETLC